jgi:hypothetical protein
MGKEESDPLLTSLIGEREGTKAWDSTTCKQFSDSRQLRRVKTRVNAFHTAHLETTANMCILSDGKVKIQIDRGGH